MPLKTGPITQKIHRKVPLDRLGQLSPQQKSAYESYLVRSCVSEFSGFLLLEGAEPAPAAGRRARPQPPVQSDGPR